MKLHAKDIAVLNGTREVGAIGRGAYDVGRIITDGAKAVHMVEARNSAISYDEWIVTRRRDLRPAHVWNLEPRITSRIEPPNVGGDPAQTLCLAFLAAAAKQMHAKADA